MNSFLWRHSVIVEERSDDGANAVTDFVGLVIEFFGVFSGELRDDAGDLSNLSHQNEHVLGHIVEDGSWVAVVGVIGAEFSQSSSGSVKSAGLHIVEDVHSLGEHFEHL